MNNESTPRFSSKRIVSLLFFVTLTFGCVIVASAQEKRPMVGGYKAAAADNPDVIAAAEFAVGEQGRKQEMTISLVSIERAESQVVAGVNYRLCLKVMLSTGDEDEDVEQMVQVVVYKNLKREQSLTSWAEEECAGSDSDGNQQK